MRDVAFVSTAVGIAGAAVIDGLTLLERLMGVRTQTPWGVAANAFLAPAQVRTTGGTILGIIASVALSIAAAFAVYLFIRWSGVDYAMLKGVLAVDALGFVTIGFLTPLLHIAPGLKRDLVSNYVALVNLSVPGLVQGYLIGRMTRYARPKASEPVR